MESKTIKEYKINFKGYDIIVPVGSIVTNKTASGFDNNYHFWVYYTPVIEKLFGYKPFILLHDLKYYGLNIPVEYCEPYPNKI